LVSGRQHGSEGPYNRRGLSPRRGGG